MFDAAVVLFQLACPRVYHRYYDYNGGFVGHTLLRAESLRGKGFGFLSRVMTGNCGDRSGMAIAAGAGRGKRGNSSYSEQLLTTAQWVNNDLNRVQNNSEEK